MGVKLSDLAKVIITASRIIGVPCSRTWLDSWGYLYTVPGSQMPWRLRPGEGLRSDILCRVGAPILHSFWECDTWCTAPNEFTDRAYRKKTGESDYQLRPELNKIADLYICMGGYADMAIEDFISNSSGVSVAELFYSTTTGSLGLR